MGPIAEDWSPQVGDVVCDCSYVHQRVIAVDAEDPDTLTLEDGKVVSAVHCCHPVPHPGYEHG